MKSAYFITMSADAHKEVVGFDIPVNEVFVVYILNTTNHLQIENTAG